MSSRFDSVTWVANMYARDEAESAEHYDSRLIKNLNSRYHDVVDGLLEKLGTVTFEFDSLAAVHRKQLRRELVGRHALPYLLTYETYFPDRTPNVDVLAALIAGHTLALTQLDYHLDGTDPDPDKPQTAVKVSQESASSYAIKMVMVAGAWGEASHTRVFTDVILPVSGFVIERMHEDWVGRYSVPDLQGIDVAVRKYLESGRSRLNASGYWEVMCRGAFSAEGETPPIELKMFVRALRLLRQLADETEDVAEDLRSGMVTLPVLLALATSRGDTLRQVIERMWKTRFATPGDWGIASDLILTDDVAERIDGIAHHLKAGLPPSSWVGYGRSDPNRPSLSVLFDLKLAVLERGLGSYVDKGLRDGPVFVGERPRECY